MEKGSVSERAVWRISRFTLLRCHSGSELGSENEASTLSLYSIHNTWASSFSLLHTSYLKKLNVNLFTYLTSNLYGYFAVVFFFYKTSLVS